ncbi:hypothetical protein J2Z83_002964 [Virgibacillus natechei]|uniref:Prolow-density lipoprotein receptor-related protein 1-like beta-propeller domain-containing protein n=1 Tax=Virgibacillus natechei TaxID=1216297 RepID=A0ABS4IIN4_9BACI|nr:DUF6612 family protein [Virgibacillus natechei]MBP1970828.1 hypothetical protein [Virgibacillus natechei]UZD12280.1 DUF5050 domain-containing protein [Virgibacillus natechei]
MKLKSWTIMATILFLMGCTTIQEDLTHEEILERTMEEMSEVESYSFEITSEQIDGFDNEAVFDIQGERLVTPFRASIQRDMEVMGQRREMKSYYIEDMVYYEDFTAPDFLFKSENDEEPDHLLDGLEALHSRFDQLKVSDDEDDYTYEYMIEQEEEQAFFSSLYPYFVITDPMEQSISDLYLDRSDIIDLHVSLTVDQEDFHVKEMNLDYVLNYDYADSGNPTELSETIEMSFSNYNELDDVPIPEEEIESAVTFQEHMEIMEEEREKEREEHVPEVMDEELGNSSANLMYDGHWATDDEWIYFSNRGKGLHKQKEDGSEREQLLENDVSHINVIGDWLFFIDRMEDSKAYRMKTDGSEREQITETYTENLIVVDDWIYFIPVTYEPDAEKAVYRMRTDLTDREQLLDNAFQFTVSQGYLIFQTEYPGNISYLDLNLGDTEAEPVMFGGVHARFFFVSDGWLYYESADDDYIYRFSLDNGQTEQLTETASYGFNADDNLIFYRNVEDDSSLYRYNVDTGENDKLDDGEVSIMYIIDEYLYYTKATTSRTPQWYRVHVDGETIEEVD